MAYSLTLYTSLIPFYTSSSILIHLHFLEHHNTLVHFPHSPSHPIQLSYTIFTYPYTLPHPSSTLSHPYISSYATSLLTHASLYALTHPLTILTFLLHLSTLTLVHLHTPYNPTTPHPFLHPFTPLSPFYIYTPSLQSSYTSPFLTLLYTPRNQPPRV